MIFLLIFIGLVVLILLVLLKEKTPVTYPYKSKKNLVTSAERSFFGVLNAAIGDSFHVFMKVRLADVLAIRKGLSKSARQSAFNKIRSKHLDFVICDKNDLSIVGVIELDDQSHKLNHRKERDLFIDCALEAAEIPFLHINAQKGYSPSELCGQLESVFKIEHGKPDVEKEEKKTIEEPKVPVCPKCGAYLVKRVAKKGKHAGQHFWGCSNFPTCKYVRAIH